MATLTHAQRVDSNRLISEYFDSLMIKYRYIDCEEPNTDYTLFGENFKMPILGAALGRHDRVHESGSLGYAKGIAAAGTLNCNGWIEDEEVEAIAAAGIRTVRGVKPFADHDRIYRCIEHDEKCGAFAVCMDIDHIFDPDGRYCDAPFGKLGRQTVEDLKGYAASTKLPFILKGVLTAEDARKALEIGAAAVIVTNHNNRFPCCVPPLVALPEVKRAVEGRIPVLVDGCIESGVEAFKALALGADGVMVCRVLMTEFSKGGPEAVTARLETMTRELAGCMANTGAVDVAHISPDSLCRKTW
ncbi:MAG: alpha-hydroxy-acid oxidizing protein [Oscillospiraceae bacterium]